MASAFIISSNRLPVCKKIKIKSKEAFKHHIGIIALNKKINQFNYQRFVV